LNADIAKRLIRLQCAALLVLKFFCALFGKQEISAQIPMRCEAISAIEFF